MTARSPAGERTFQRAVVYSAVFHAVLFTLVALSPSMPKPARKGMVHYVSLGGLRGGGGPGGGGGGGAAAAAAAPAPAKKETLRDLTLASKAKPEPKPSMTYPVDKPKRGRTEKEPKKAAISKPQPDAATSADAAGARTGGARTGNGAGSGVRIGFGEGPGGGGPGSGYGDQIGLSDFPYQYYLQIITDRVSSSWFTALVDPGVAGTFYSTVYFKILRNGQVSELKITESSGIASLDMSAQRAIQISAPFPPLPSDYDGAYLGIHLIFEHSK